jgi:hypothetical protein
MTHLTSLQTEFLETVLSLKPRVAAFDCDGTLWSEDAGEGFFHWELDLAPEKRLCPSRSCNGPVSAMPTTKRAASTKIPCAEKWSPCTADCAKKSCSRRPTPILLKPSPPRFFPEMRELVERLRQSGCDVWAVSSSCLWVIRSGMRYFGIPAKSHSGRRSNSREWPDHRPSNSSSQRPRQAPGASLRAEIVARPQARLRLRQRDLGPRDASHVEPPLRNQPQPGSKRDRHRQPLEDLSAGHEPRWPLNPSCHPERSRDFTK